MKLKYVLLYGMIFIFLMLFSGIQGKQYYAIDGTPYTVIEEGESLTPTPDTGGWKSRRECSSDKEYKTREYRDIFRETVRCVKGLVVGTIMFVDQFVKDVGDSVEPMATAAKDVAIEVNDELDKALKDTVGNSTTAKGDTTNAYTQ